MLLIKVLFLLLKKISIKNGGYYFHLLSFANVIVVSFNREEEEVMPNDEFVSLDEGFGSSCCCRLSRWTGIELVKGYWLLSSPSIWLSSSCEN